MLQLSVAHAVPIRRNWSESAFSSDTIERQPTIYPPFGERDSIFFVLPALDVGRAVRVSTTTFYQFGNDPLMVFVEVK